MIWSFAVPLLLTFTNPPFQAYLPKSWNEISFSILDYLVLLTLPFFLWGLHVLCKAVVKKQGIYNRAASLRSENKSKPIRILHAWLLELSTPKFTSVLVQFLFWGYFTYFLFLGENYKAEPAQTGAVLGAGASILFPIVIFLLGLNKDQDPLEVPHHQLFLRFTYALPGAVLILSALLWIFVLQHVWVIRVFTILILVTDGTILFRVFHLYNDEPLQKQYAQILSRWSIYGW